MKCVTHARVLSSTFVNGNSKNEMRQSNRGSKKERKNEYVKSKAGTKYVAKAELYIDKGFIT